MHKIVIAMLLAVGSNAALAGWESIGGSDSQTAYADLTTIRRNGDQVKLWSLYDYQVAKMSTDGKPYLSMRTLEEYDCKEDQMRLLTVSAHAGQMAAGEIVASDFDAKKWQPVAPGSIAAALLKIACGKP